MPIVIALDSKSDWSLFLACIDALRRAAARAREQMAQVGYPDRSGNDSAIGSHQVCKNAAGCAAEANIDPTIFIIEPTNYAITS